MQYQIARCSAPCVGHISEVDYGELVREAGQFLRGSSTNVQEVLAEQMSEASEKMEFERAAALRDRIKALTNVQQVQGINPDGVREADIVALHMEGGQACVQVFFIRANQNWGNRAYFPRTGSGAEAAEVLEGFLGQFYSNKTPPSLVLLSDMVENHDLVEQLLTDKREKKVEVLVPQRGEKLGLLAGALRNARESLARKMAETSTQRSLLVGLKEAFELKEVPKRVEVYDNSHIQGTNAVGGMIVAGPEGYMKSAYRKFNIKGNDLTPGDDFGMMKEVLNRRFKRLLKEDPFRKSENWPGLILIDGGGGQVSAVQEIFRKLNVHDVPLIGVAKGVDRDAGKEEFYRANGSKFALRFNDPVLYFVQRLRDEAHRFAIGTHRAKRSKAQFANPLDEVMGVGSGRKRALLLHFGSAKAVSRAGLEDLKAVSGISGTLAQTIYDFFHDKG